MTPFLTLLVVQLNVGTVKPAVVKPGYVVQTLAYRSSASSPSLALAEDPSLWRLDSVAWSVSSSKPDNATGAKDAAAVLAIWAAHPETTLDPSRQTGYTRDARATESGPWVVEVRSWQCPSLADAQDALSAVYSAGRAMTQEEARALDPAVAWGSPRLNYVTGGLEGGPPDVSDLRKRLVLARWPALDLCALSVVRRAQTTKPTLAKPPYPAASVETGTAPMVPVDTVTTTGATTTKTPAG